MSIDKVKQNIQEQIDFAFENRDVDIHAKSWGYEEGVLISIDEAKQILEALKLVTFKNSGC